MKRYPDLDDNIFHSGDHLHNINEDECTRVNEGITLYRFTYNFFQYFPGIRNYYSLASKIPEEKKKLIKDLDLLLEKSDFDYLKLKPCYEAKKQDNPQQLFDLIWPIYKRMIALGYEKEDLFKGFEV